MNMMIDPYRKEYFYPLGMDKEKILPDGIKLGEYFNLTLLDKNGVLRRFSNIRLVLDMEINNAHYIEGALTDEPDGVYYVLKLDIYRYEPYFDKAFLYPSGWPIKRKPKNK